MNAPLWITYAWSDNALGDFDYLIQDLSRAGISAKYDKISIIPGRKLWAQIADRIFSDSLAGWAYLITPNSLASTACQEELAYALQRALESRGDEFPLIGLLHGVSISDVPLALRVRLCVNLANPDWIEEIREAITGSVPRRSVPEQKPLIIKIHRQYLGQSDKVAVEICPRFGELRYWRLAFPSSGPQPVAWGTGPANGRGIGAIKTEVKKGEFPDIEGIPMKFVGAGNPVTPSTSAYAVFDRELPQKCFFGVAKKPYGNMVTGGVYLGSAE
ncbi:MAG: toll/interleukin-1 receptor domain-containing protein [Candidatus Sumerlaeota bacterium]|nr:toll/interleukin-1 receptor domain-containing protein [Candidatus Sumerlaeota bacterium]